jgi:uncharacterized SAM-binding protein YcdF (DUF218 family)
MRRLKALAALLGVLLLAVPWKEGGAPVLIVLGGDSVRDGMLGTSSYWRSVYAVDLWRWGGIRHIVISGDPETTASMRAWILGQGIPADAVTVEGRSKTTRENALCTAALARDVPGPYLLLTSDIHMWRALHAFRKAGIAALPRPAPDAFKRGNDPRDRWRVFEDIVSECAGILYYKAKGWV